MRLVPVGPSALLVEVGDAPTALDLADWARRERVALDVVPGAETVLLDGIDDVPALRSRLAGSTSPVSPVSPGSTGSTDDGAERDVVEVPVSYDGPDLDDVAARWGTDRDGVVERHTGLTFVSAFCGFAPGFAYLAGLPAALAVPRLATPRARVPAGAVGLADTWCGAYPTASPGGWRLLGRTDVRLWDVDRDPPALLAPGTRVRFVPR